MDIGLILLTLSLVGWGLLAYNMHKNRYKQVNYGVKFMTVLGNPSLWASKNSIANKLIVVLYTSFLIVSPYLVIFLLMAILIDVDWFPIKDETKDRA